MKPSPLPKNSINQEPAPNGKKYLAKSRPPKVTVSDISPKEQLKRMSSELRETQTLAEERLQEIVILSRMVIDLKAQMLRQGAGEKPRAARFKNSGLCLSEF